LLGRNGYARRFEVVFAASGTPVPRNPSEFSTILVALFPEIAAPYQTHANFEAHFCVTRVQFFNGTMHRKVIATKNDAEFRDILKQCMLRRTLDEVGIDVPKIFWQTIPLEAQGATDDDIGEVPYVLKTHKGQLADMANEPHIARYRRRVGELKIAPVVQMLCDELTGTDEKVVVFAYHLDVLQGINQGLIEAGIENVCIRGTTPPAQRDLMIDQFQTSPNVRVFIGQNIACQTGVTLHAAHRCILVEPQWVDTENVQLASRVARIGSTAKRCIAQMVAISGTLDEWIVAQNKREAEIQTKMFTHKTKWEDS
jgi:SNF2 family DNA or RNA helicase